ncbi:LANO_0G09846g1_1 [Lachancea nothofagi CBS 11611]|uniref:Transcription and mRNA export factor SUS1 n=1 Tax=Lachancea nothofagi CBS 11611 TaxID=1266666 RepID=A0A1G4KIJ9_9SACH|nr:LANO_0G09846g1_1 [Lachancea nothofagi CBS 11611]
MTSSDSRTMQLKAQIQQHLVESGNYELISNKLSQKLLQEGWTDQVKKLTSDEINNDGSATFTQILAKVEPIALEMVSESTREEIISQITSFLSEIVDTD